MVSLNIIKEEILAFASGHGQLNSAKFCAPYDLLDSGDVAYPTLYFDYVNGRKDKREFVMTFTAYVADRVNPEKDNEADVWSDTTLIMCDLLGYLDSDERNYRLQEGANLKPFREATGDNLGGVSTDFTIRIPFPFDRCVIPTRSNGTLIITENGFTILTEDGQALETET